MCGGPVDRVTASGGYMTIIIDSYRVADMIMNEVCRDTSDETSGLVS